MGSICFILLAAGSGAFGSRTDRGNHGRIPEKPEDENCTLERLPGLPPGGISGCCKFLKIMIEIFSGIYYNRFHRGMAQLG